MKAKQWYQSKTLWIAILQLVASIIGIIVGILQQPDITLPAVLLAGKSLLDLWIRFKTNTAIK